MLIVEVAGFLIKHPTEISQLPHRCLKGLEALADTFETSLLTALVGRACLLPVVLDLKLQATQGL